MPYKTSIDTRDAREKLRGCVLACDLALGEGFLHRLGGLRHQ